MPDQVRHDERTLASQVFYYYYYWMKKIRSKVHKHFREILFQENRLLIFEYLELYQLRIFENCNILS